MKATSRGIAVFFSKAVATAGAIDRYYNKTDEVHAMRENRTRRTRYSLLASLVP